VASPLRQIFAFSGVLDSGAAEKPSFARVEYAVALAARARGARAGRTQVCYVPTAVGDAQAAIDFYEDKFAAGRRAAERAETVHPAERP
jgi:hypothetical protein